MAVMITGGARSGKSDFAERYAMRMAESGIYIATSQSWDDEMTQRIARHRRSREAAAFPWRTIEEPLDIAAILQRLDQEAAEEGSGCQRPAVLVDCLTLWLTNWILKLDAEEDPAAGPTGPGDCQSAKPQGMEAVADELIAAVAAYSGPLLLVTNEVGSGIVPAYPLGRRFRDEAGRLNRRLAAVCEQAFLVVAGFPLDLKTLAFRLEDE
ncbi:bifunctional adenosylcobinamide kinase/adenosylcobinamide-phosphate guanylyltransferase [Paenibacillus nasutitermitis]|uniref:Adenosylcobinamide kinase n=1 Tax=Paenibacillus nasutitermitis TaxID=1652958 RepID=A0A916YY79_9BACL|nr:bifunctional adenosylcobinamide kinase/adenosylcobinamide-phosphate guanylyltransferase [Paenibacillus nasutitermitis]GGD67566.1 adenosylcobinamide kinase/adenosylcobinamide phosphate guanyltransferase [Paenibacillus nasutitermitis]